MFQTATETLISEPSSVNLVYIMANSVKYNPPHIP